MVFYFGHFPEVWVRPILPALHLGFPSFGLFFDSDPWQTNTQIQGETFCALGMSPVAPIVYYRLRCFELYSTL